MNEEGTYIVHPASGKIVDFVPNPLQSGPAFVVAKRFSFDQIQGQFDQTIGLMSAMAKINIMSVIAMEDAVFTETNVVGEIESGQYRKGRFAVNYLTPGSQVVKPVNNLPYQLFEQVGRIERHLRVVAGYPVQDDAISPNSFVTGRGLEELQSGVSLMVREYQQVLSKALEDVDYKRLELDEVLFSQKRKPLSGYIRGAAFQKTILLALILIKITKLQEFMELWQVLMSHKRLLQGCNYFKQVLSIDKLCRKKWTAYKT